MTQGTIMGCTCWVLVHPDGRVNWRSIDFREDRPRVWKAWTKWRWQRWLLSPDHHDYPFKSGHQ
jgi:hypothetical protein